MAGGRRAFIMLHGLRFGSFPQLRAIPGEGRQLPAHSAAGWISASVLKGDLGGTEQNASRNCPCRYGVKSHCFGFQGNLTWKATNQYCSFLFWNNVLSRGKTHYIDVRKPALDPYFAIHIALWTWIQFHSWCLLFLPSQYFFSFLQIPRPLFHLRNKPGPSPPVPTVFYILLLDGHVSQDGQFELSLSLA